MHTDAPEAAGRRILLHLEAAWDFFGAKGDAPLQVLAFAHLNDFVAIRPASGVAGFAQTSLDGDIIVLSVTDDSRRVAMHEFSHVLLNRNSVHLPHWFEEGLSEFFSTIEMSGPRLHIGGSIPSYEGQLREFGVGTPRDFDNPKASHFYPRSWALVHMLYIDPAFRSKIHELVSEMGTGESDDAAFQKVYGKSFADVVNALDSYIRRPYRSVTVDTDRQSNTRVKISPYTIDEAMELQAEVLERQDRWSAAERIYQKLAKIDSNSASYHHWLAGRAVLEKRYAEAGTELQIALRSRPSDGAILFDYAMLLRETNAPSAKVTEALQRTVEASPTLAQAHLLLGEQLSAQGDSQGALQHFKRATELRPRDAFTWQALAIEYHRAGNITASHDAARRSRTAAVTPQEIAMAESAIGLEAPSKPVKPAAAVQTPSSWDNPKGDATIEGRLSDVDCSANPLTLRVNGDLFQIKDPNRIVLRGTPGTKTELRCGPQNLAVTVEYKQSSREVTSIEFR